MNNELTVKNQNSLILSDDMQDQMITKRNHIIQFSNTAPKYLLAKEMLTFFDFIENYNHLIFFKTLWITGGRVSEVLSLKPKNFCFFGFDGCMLTMPNLKQKPLLKKKNNVYSEVQATKQLALSNMHCNAEYIKEIKRYIVTKEIKEDDFIFQNSDGKPYTRYQISYLINKIQQSVENKGYYIFPFKITPHTFRHSCAMHLYYSGASEKFIKEYLGHAHARNTQVYTKLFHHEEDVSNIRFF